MDKRPKPKRPQHDGKAQAHHPDESRSRGTQKSTNHGHDSATAQPPAQAEREPSTPLRGSPVDTAYGIPAIQTDEPADSPAVQLGPVSIEAAPGWWFYPMQDALAGRPLHGGGVFMVRPVRGVRLPKPATHEICMSVAKSRCGYEVKGTGSDPARDRVGRAVVGGESFRVGATFVRVYYHFGPRGFAIGTFSCKQARMVERTLKQALRDCDHMMLSLRKAPPLPS